MLNSEKMKSTCFGLFIAGLSLMIFSCVERIDIKLDDSYTKLVVDGGITTDTMAHTILLSQSVGYYYNQPAPSVSGAIVQISDGTDLFTLDEESPGVYRTDPSLFGVAGKTYTLDIKLAAQIGGFTDYTAWSTLYPASNLDLYPCPIRRSIRSLSALGSSTNLNSNVF
jgi:hypothetical protein